MTGYIVRRLLQMIPVLIGISFITFLIIRLAPGDPIATMYPPEVIGRVDTSILRQRLGLDDPIPLQYLRMIGGLLSGTLNSFQESRPTLDLIRERLPITALFALLSLGLALLIGIPVAVLSAVRPYSWLDNLFTTLALAGLSIPAFWLALVLILMFSEQLRVLPASGIRPTGADGYDLRQMFPYLIMPTLVMTVGLLPSVVRYTRSAMIEALGQDYVRTARSKGLSGRAVVSRHALRNALIPVISLVGTIFPLLLGGAVLVEQIFGIPGMGRLAVRAAQNRDFPLILTLNMISAVIVLTSTFITDIVYTVLDPRVQMGRRS